MTDQRTFIVDIDGSLHHINSPKGFQIKLKIAGIDGDVIPMWSSQDRFGRAFVSVHQKAIDRILKGQIPEELLEKLKDQQITIDEYQGDGDLYLHANIPKDGDKQIEIEKAEIFVRENLKEAQKLLKGRDVFSLSDSELTKLASYLGNVIHIVTDSTSPAHEGFQEFDNRPIMLILKGPFHVLQENHYPIEGSIERTRLDGSVQWIWDILVKKNTMPSNFFDKNTGQLNLPEKYYHPHLPKQIEIESKNPKFWRI
ncbi:hypothetical protein P3G55_20590 [Leptospira sp. 96542]|nr:hypothetical protein [Leptospira sp. 96542]